MIFSKLARILAIVAVALGVFDIVLGFSVANMDEAARGSYLGGSTSGEKIDAGIYTILFAIALGTPAEINLSIRKAIEATE